MKYSIQEYDGGHYHAGGKAKNDVCRILKTHGYHTLHTNFRSNLLDRFNKIRNIKESIKLNTINLFVKKGDKVLLQWPFYKIRNINRLYNLLSQKDIELTLLIHDIDILRNFRNSLQEDLLFAQLSQKIIVHSERMRNFLIEKNIDERKIKILNTFDYLTNNSEAKERNFSTTIVYAGNLKKAQFIKDINPYTLNIRLYCYGAFFDGLNDKVTYKGCFSPDDVHAIEGSWGLVWDGDSIHSCTGDFGNYMRYNSPHKLSLYISAGIPIIIWKQAAMAKYVEEKHIGIAVESLEELKYLSEKISPSEYAAMVGNIKKEAEEITKGRHLASLL